MQPTISIVYPDGVWKEESEAKERGTTSGRGYKRNELVDLDEEYCSHGRKTAPGNFAAAIHGELACYDVEQGAGKVAAAGVRQHHLHHQQCPPGAASEKKTVSFAAAVIRGSDDSMILAESNRLEDTTTTTTAAAAAEQRKTQRRFEHREPSLPVQVIAVVGHRQGGAGAGGRRVGDETTTISTLSFGHKTPVQVATPRETPSFYVGVGLALVVTAVSAFLIAFYLTMRPR